jgi:GntR family transcriptional regulator
MWLSIDNKSGRPIYLQIILQIKDQVRNGDLKTGDELPSVRELAGSTRRLSQAA